MIVPLEATRKTQEWHAQAELLQQIDSEFLDYSVVWAKLKGFPWWPGVLFRSWQAVIASGLSLPDGYKALPLPEKHPDDVNNPDAPLVSSCVVLFLDENNYSILKLDPRDIRDYGMHYHEMAERQKFSEKHKRLRASFKRALVNADQLLHMGEEYTEEDAQALAQVSPVISVVPEWEEVETPKSAPKKVKKNGRASKQRKKVETDEDLERPVPKKSRKVEKRETNGRKKPTKEKKVSSVNVTDESETIVESVDPPTASPIQETSPLSFIWTKHKAQASSDTKLLQVQQDLVWDDTIFADDGANVRSDVEKPKDEGRSKRSSRSVQQNQIRENLVDGNLDPHTMVQCELYKGDAVSGSRQTEQNLDAPFQVKVHPDATFISDLHAHLATCEIIGFLGGKWDAATRTLYIQAAFPCRSLMIDGDDGSTDVEMDPGSEVELREIIQNAELEVVGWYHSHPTFAPDPSVRDIDNQTSYQQLFKRDDGEVKEPFVGCIVGTYDTKRTTPVSLFRYFHVRQERLRSGSLKVVGMPYQLCPVQRTYKRTEYHGETVYSSVWKYLYSKTSPASKATEDMEQTKVKRPVSARRKRRKPMATIKKPQTVTVLTSSLSGEEHPSGRMFETKGKTSVVGPLVQASQTSSNAEEKDSNGDEKEAKVEKELVDYRREVEIAMETMKKYAVESIGEPSVMSEKEMRLQALRTKYGRSMYVCTEQVIAVIDYYSTFPRRIDLQETWKSDVFKKDKLRASLQNYVRHLHMPPSQHDSYIDDVMGYLLSSWEL